jgi:hypothetical protein
MIDVKEAVQRARQYLMELFSDEQPQLVRLEEVELSEDEGTWRITLSFFPGTAPKSLAAALGLPVPEQREYKTVAIRAADGKVQSVRIRQLV